MDRKVLDRLVTAAHAFAESLRFDGRGMLVIPETALTDDPDCTRDASGERVSFQELARRQQAEANRAAVELWEAAMDRPATPEELERLTDDITTPSLRLASGAHLAAGSRYLLVNLPADPGTPVDGGPADLPAGSGDGEWSDADVTITPWDPCGTSGVEFSVPAGTVPGDPPALTGTLVHDVPAGLLSGTFALRLPGPGTRLRSASGAFRLDTGAWYHALAGRTGLPRCGWRSPTPWPRPPSASPPPRTETAAGRSRRSWTCAAGAPESADHLHRLETAMATAEDEDRL